MRFHSRWIEKGEERIGNSRWRRVTPVESEKKEIKPAKRKMTIERPWSTKQRKEAKSDDERFDHDRDTTSKRTRCFCSFDFKTTKVAFIWLIRVSRLWHFGLRLQPISVCLCLRLRILWVCQLLLVPKSKFFDKRLHFWACSSIRSIPLLQTNTCAKHLNFGQIKRQPKSSTFNMVQIDSNQSTGHGKQLTCHKSSRSPSVSFAWVDQKESAAVHNNLEKCHMCNENQEAKRSFEFPASQAMLTQLPPLSLRKFGDKRFRVKANRNKFKLQIEFVL